jgi:hypothetical protein
MDPVTVAIGALILSGVIVAKFPPLAKAFDWVADSVVGAAKFIGGASTGARDGHAKATGKPAKTTTPATTSGVTTATTSTTTPATKTRQKKPATTGTTPAKQAAAGGTTVVCGPDTVDPDKARQRHDKARARGYRTGWAVGTSTAAAGGFVRGGGEGYRHVRETIRGPATDTPTTTTDPAITPDPPTTEEKPVSEATTATATSGTDTAPASPTGDQTHTSVIQEANQDVQQLVDGEGAIAQETQQMQAKVQQLMDHLAKIEQRKGAIAENTGTFGGDVRRQAAAQAGAARQGRNAGQAALDAISHLMQAVSSIAEAAGSVAKTAERAVGS